MTTVQTITTEELLAMPDDGMDRELIDGVLREKPMPTRNRVHSRTVANSVILLGIWDRGRQQPRGEILAGDAAFRLRQNPDTTVGVDVAYISAEMAKNTPNEQRIIDGAPVLAVEVLSPSDRHEDIVEKIQLYLAAGVAVVWIIDPDLRTITVHRGGAAPELFNVQQEISGEPELPGFRAAVAEFFAGSGSIQG